jgi:hypothetical protein
VPADYDAPLSRMEAEGLLVRQERDLPSGYVGYYYKPGPGASVIQQEFSESERRVLEFVARSIGALSAKAASDKSHQEPAWWNTETGKLISYQHARWCENPFSHLRPRESFPASRHHGAASRSAAGASRWITKTHQCRSPS